jgi:hypothetical protein
MSDYIASYGLVSRKNIAYKLRIEAVMNLLLL